MKIPELPRSWTWWKTVTSGPGSIVLPQWRAVTDDWYLQVQQVELDGLWSWDARFRVEGQVIGGSLAERVAAVDRWYEDDACQVIGCGLALYAEQAQRYAIAAAGSAYKLEAYRARRLNETL